MLSVVAYSFFASGVVQSLLQLLLAFLRSPDDVDPKSFLLNKGSILAASPAAFVSADDNPVLFTALSYFDVFSIWYLVLVTIGIAMVLVIALRTGAGRPPRPPVLRMVGLYWHFVDIVWIFLFPLIYLPGRAG